MLRIIAVGGVDRVITTADGGNTWQAVNTGITNTLNNELQHIAASLSSDTDGVVSAVLAEAVKNEWDAYHRRMEVCLALRKVADKRIFPALDVGKSGTRKEELLRSEEELRLVHVMHKILSDMNPVEAMGYAAFAEAAAQAGVDGVLTVDLPPEEAHELTQALLASDLDPIFLLAPTSTEARIRRIGALARGYLYYVSLKGVTGSARLNTGEVAEKVARIKALVDVPVGVGFGIRDADSAAAVARVADAVVVGSALVSRIEALAGDPQQLNAEIGALLGAMRTAMDAVTA